MSEALGQTTIVIPTRNRKHELSRALESCLRQTAECEVIVFDDASTDGTGELVRERFPQVTYVRVEQRTGQMTLRNRGIEMARHPIVFSIDDDAYFSNERIVAETLGCFDSPDIAVVAVPLMDLREARWRQQAPTHGRQWCSASFVAAAHAVRREAFLRVGGYPTNWDYYGGEETALSLRLLDARYLVRLGTSAPVIHSPSTMRSYREMARSSRRNSLTLAWSAIPLPSLVPQLAWRATGGLFQPVGSVRSVSSVPGMIAGIRDLISGRVPRSPIDRRAWRAYRLMARNGPIPAAEIRRRLGSGPSAA